MEYIKRMKMENQDYKYEITIAVDIDKDKKSVIFYLTRFRNFTPRKTNGIFIRQNIPFYNEKILFAQKYNKNTNQIEYEYFEIHDVEYWKV
jgi:uncharacterized HAD superfamily protein